MAHHTRVLEKTRASGKAFKLPRPNRDFFSENEEKNGCKNSKTAVYAQIDIYKQMFY